MLLDRFSTLTNPLHDNLESACIVLFISSLFDGTCM